MTEKTTAKPVSTCCAVTYGCAFSDNFYYVAVTLSAPERVVVTPPAVALVQLVPWEEDA
jgi:hypothetical protein